MSSYTRLRYRVTVKIDNLFRAGLHLYEIWANKAKRPSGARALRIQTGKGAGTFDETNNLTSVTITI